jgi:Family of unknown function (DUF6328)
VQSDRDETRSERADRNFSEAVQELRVAQAGVQILFAFLLTLPFLREFPDARAFSVALTLALFTAAGAVLCFTAPVVAHRLYFRRGLKEEVVWWTHWMSLAGLTLLALSMTCAAWLVVARLWSTTSASVVAVAMLLVVTVVWVVLPWRLMARTD